MLKWYNIIMETKPHFNTGRKSPFLKPMIGKQFGRLRVVSRAPSKDPSNAAAYWLCRCECGKEIVTRGLVLRKGTTKSCGCYSRDIARQTAQSRRKSPEQKLATIRDYKFRYKYGITLEERNRMALLQEEKCAICGNIEKLYVDHNHSNGKVRGLLCCRCNLMIGHVEESIAILQKAIVYLSRWESEHEWLEVANA